MSRLVLPVTALCLLPAGCAAQEQQDQETRARTEAAVDERPEADREDQARGPHNALTEAEREAGWQLLFDGRSTDGWRGYRREGVPDGWVVESGALHRAGPAGDLITEEEFGDFELSLEWKVAPGGNSGVFYRATEELDATYKTAPEMQVLDDAGHPDGGSPLTAAGSVYGLYAAPPGVVRPPGEWNRARVLVDGWRVEHWLNGTKLFEYELGSDEWERRVEDSKFAQWPAYGRAARGHIGLQDHGDPVWFRSLKIRERP